LPLVVLLSSKEYPYLCRTPSIFTSGQYVLRRPSVCFMSYEQRNVTVLLTCRQVLLEQSDGLGHRTLSGVAGSERKSPPSLRVPQLAGFRGLAGLLHGISREFLATSIFYSYLDGRGSARYDVVRVRTVKAERHALHDFSRVRSCGISECDRYGQKPVGVDEERFRTFRAVCEKLVAKKKLLPDILGLFDSKE
jgi:hypothetical protein